MDLAEYAANQSKQFLLLVPWCQHFLGKENRRYNEGNVGGRREEEGRLGLAMRLGPISVLLISTPHYFKRTLPATRIIQLFKKTPNRFISDPIFI